MSLLTSVQRKPFKVCNNERNLKKGIMASSLTELINKGVVALIGENKTSAKPQVVLDEDNTIVDDEEYFSSLPENTVLMLLFDKESWSSPDSYSVASDEADGQDMFECAIEGDHSQQDHLTLVISKLKNDIHNVIYLNDDEMQYFVDGDTKQLAHSLKKSEKLIKNLQEFCQQHLDEKANRKEIFDLFNLYSDARKNQESTGRKRKKDS